MSNSSSHPSPGDGRMLNRADVVDATAAEMIGAFVPKRSNTFPVLETAEAQDRFLTSPMDVVSSLGIRIPAHLAEHLRRSSVPPPPPAAVLASEPASEPVLEAEAEPALESAPAPKRARGRVGASKKR